jgi:hypothetical protein
VASSRADRRCFFEEKIFSSADEALWLALITSVARGTARMARAVWRSRPRGLLARLALALSLLVVGARAAGTCADGRGGRAACAELRPRAPLLRETARLDGAPRLYALAGLAPNTAYEVRVSYPATNPADITLELVGSDPPQRPAKGRRMLNVEKLVLSSRRVGEATLRLNSKNSNLVVRLDAKTYGRHRDGKQGAFDEVVYDVVLEPAIDPFGALPLQAAPVALAAVSCCALAFWMEPIIRELIWPSRRSLPSKAS